MASCGVTGAGAGRSASACAAGPGQPQAHSSTRAVSSTQWRVCPRRKELIWFSLLLPSARQAVVFIAVVYVAVSAGGRRARERPATAISGSVSSAGDGDGDGDGGGFVIGYVFYFFYFMYLVGRCTDENVRQLRRHMYLCLVRRIAAHVLAGK